MRVDDYTIDRVCPRCGKTLPALTSMKRIYCSEMCKRDNEHEKRAQRVNEAHSRMVGKSYWAGRKAVLTYTPEPDEYGYRPGALFNPNEIESGIMCEGFAQGTRFEIDGKEWVVEGYKLVKSGSND